MTPIPSFVRLAVLIGAAALLPAAPALAADSPAAPAAPPPDTRIVTAAELKSVTEYFAAKGIQFQRSASTSGNPLLTEKANEAFKVSFFCGVGDQACNGQSYNTLIMWACDDEGANRTADRSNTVNKGKVFGRSYIDATGKACVEQEVVTGVAGITYDVMNVYYAGFTYMRTQLPQFYL